MDVISLTAIKINIAFNYIKILDYEKNKCIVGSVLMETCLDPNTYLGKFSR